jgi:hypothetical protein
MPQSLFCFGGWTEGWRPCSVRNPNKWKLDTIWQNLLRKAMGQKRDVLLMMMIITTVALYFQFIHS